MSAEAPADKQSAGLVHFTTSAEPNRNSMESQEATQVKDAESKIPQGFKELPYELQLDIIDNLVQGPVEVVRGLGLMLALDSSADDGINKILTSDDPILKEDALKAWYKAINNHTGYVQLKTRNNAHVLDLLQEGRITNNDTNLDFFRRVLIKVKIYYQHILADLEVVKEHTFDLRCGDDRIFRLHSLCTETIHHPRSYSAETINAFLNLADTEDWALRNALCEAFFIAALNNKHRGATASLAKISQNVDCVVLNGIGDAAAQAGWTTLHETDIASQSYEDALCRVPAYQKLGWRGPQTSDGPATLLELGSLDFDATDDLLPAKNQPSSTWTVDDHSLDSVYPYWLDFVA